MKRSKLLFQAFWLMFFLYGINNTVFERILFFNEILALLGIGFFIKHLITERKSKQFLFRESALTQYVLLFICLGGLHLIFSWNIKTNLYYYARSSVIIYSTFTFFVAFFAYPYLREFLSNIRLGLWAYLIFALIFPSNYLLERYMGIAFFPYLFKKYKKTTGIALLLFGAALSYSYESSTAIVCTIIALVIFTIPNYKIFKIGFFTSLIVVCGTFIYLKPNLELYKTGPYLVIGNVQAVHDSHPMLSVDGNSTWRAVFWYRLIVEELPNHITGKGFGTPLLPYIEGADTIPLEHDDEYDMHVTGAHNTYLTILMRMGVVALLLICLIFHKVLSFYYKNKKSLQKQQSSLFFYSFFSVSTVGLFNLLLESPTVASLFWGLLGIIAAIMWNFEEEAENE